MPLNFHVKPFPLWHMAVPVLFCSI